MTFWKISKFKMRTTHLLFLQKIQNASFCLEPGPFTVSWCAWEAIHSRLTFKHLCGFGLGDFSGHEHPFPKNHATLESKGRVLACEHPLLSISAADLRMQIEHFLHPEKLTPWVASLSEHVTLFWRTLTFIWSALVLFHSRQHLPPGHCTNIDFPLIFE